MTERNRDDVARRIRALRMKTVANGCTEAEAIAAAELAGRLMAELHLTQSDIELQDDPVVDWEVKRRQRLKQVSEDTCLRGLTRYAGVKYYWRPGRDERRVVFHGWQADCEHAEWLYKMIGRTIMAAAEIYKTEIRHEPWNMTDRRRALLDFRMGMAARINQRLHQMADELEPVAKTGSGNQLMIVRNAVVNASFEKLALKNGRGYGRTTRQGSAFAQGWAEGANVGLHRPVGGGPKGYLN